MSTENPVIGVDLDEVCFEYQLGLRKWIKDHQNRTVPAGQPASWDLVDSGWFRSTEEFFKCHHDYVNSGFYENLKMKKGAAFTLKDLSQNGYQINIITSRFVLPGQHAKIVSQTVKALDANKIPYNNISFLSNKVFQYADAYIDDSPSNIQRLFEADRNIIAFDMKYNQSCVSSSRAKNWNEVRKILKDTFGK